MVDVLFFLISLMIVFFATLVVTLPNVLHCALSLMVVLFGSAGLYILMHAEFAALAQIAVYVGGVIIFMTFAIFLTTRMGDRTKPLSLPKMSWALVLSLSSFVGFYLFYDKYLSTITTNGSVDSEAGSISAVGKRFLSTGDQGFIVPFEVVSVLLLMTVIGAIVIARNEAKTALGGVDKNHQEDAE